MNSTGCPEYFAQDEVMIKVANAPCSLPVPFFIAICEVYALAHFFVASKRTQIIVSRNRKRKTAGNKLQSNGGNSWLALFKSLATNATLLQSWASCIIVGLIPLVTFVKGPSTVMLGLLFVAFGVQSELWLAKLIRLGGRLITKHTDYNNSSNSASSNNGSPAAAAGGGYMEERDRILKLISKSDVVLKICMLTFRVSLVVQFVMLVILNSIFPEEFLWLKIGVGIQGCLVLLWLCATNWQYKRCESAILQVSKVVEDMRLVSNDAGRHTKVQGVVQKMTEQRKILSMFALPGIIVHWMWAAGVFPINYWVIIGAELFDCAVQATVLSSFVRRRGTKPSTTTVTEMNSYTAFSGGGGGETKGEQNGSTLSVRMSAPRLKA